MQLTFMGGRELLPFDAAKLADVSRAVAGALDWNLTDANDFVSTQLLLVEDRSDNCTSGQATQGRRLQVGAHWRQCITMLAGIAARPGTGGSQHLPCTPSVCACCGACCPTDTSVALWNAAGHHSTAAGRLDAAATACQSHCDSYFDCHAGGAHSTSRRAGVYCDQVHPHPGRPDALVEG